MSFSVNVRFEFIKTIVLILLVGIVYLSRSELNLGRVLLPDNRSEFIKANCAMKRPDALQ